MPRPAFALAVVLAATAAIPAAAAPPSQPASAATAPAALPPKETMLASEEATRKGGMAVALSYYHITNADEERLAKLFAAWDLSVVRLRDAAAAKFGKDGAEEAFHAAGMTTREDYKAEEEWVEGDRATVTFKNCTDDRLIRVGGRRKVDLSGDAREEKEAEGRMSRVLAADTESMNRKAADVAAGQYDSPKAVGEAVTKRFDAARQWARLRPSPYGRPPPALRRGTLRAMTGPAHWAVRALALLLLIAYVAIQVFSAWAWAGPIFGAVFFGLFLFVKFLVPVAEGMKKAEYDGRVREGRCLGCGYSLRANVSGVCPECGTKVGGDKP